MESSNINGIYFVHTQSIHIFYTACMRFHALQGGAMPT